MLIEIRWIFNNDKRINPASRHNSCEYIQGTEIHEHYLTEMNREIDNSKIIVEDLILPLSTMGRITKQKITGKQKTKATF